MRILFLNICLIFLGCVREAEPENIQVNIPENNVKPNDFENDITEIIGTFSALSAVDGEWDEYAEEKTKKVADLKPIENGKLAYCYDTQTLLKLEIYGSVYNATIEYIEGSLTVIAKNVNIDGIYTIPANKLGQHGKLVIKGQDKVIYEVLIQAEGCL